MCAKEEPLRPATFLYFCDKIIDLPFDFICRTTSIDDFANAGLTQFWELFTMIPYAQ